MQGVEAVRTALMGTQHLVNWFLSDLTDADLVVRAVPGSNHIAWQMAHLITSEAHLVHEQLPQAVFPELPADFGAKHKDPQSDHGMAKAVYLELFGKTREATLAALGTLSDADLDRPTVGKMAPFAPTLGALLLLVSNHSLMHGGQFSVVRRKLGKPVLF
ncbi:MAG: DinB family protein [Gemmataceae bacterium]